MDFDSPDTPPLLFHVQLTDIFLINHLIFNNKSYRLKLSKMQLIFNSLAKSKTSRQYCTELNWQKTKVSSLLFQTNQHYPNCVVMLKIDLLILQIRNVASNLCMDSKHGGTGTELRLDICVKDGSERTWSHEQVC